MRILLVGAGGVGDAIAKIAAEREFFEVMVVADYDVSKAERTVEWIRAKNGSDVASKFVTAKIDASSADNIAAVC
ncbi:MAG: ATP-binding protein, partial [Microbacteriaceae bacterium]|nr:ATP-binding protein [Microbacteriaceae bacterium]